MTWLSRPYHHNRPSFLQGVVPYEQRVFPLNNAEYMIMVRETDDCDIGPPSPPLDSSSHEPINMEEVRLQVCTNNNIKDHLLRNR